MGQGIEFKFKPFYDKHHSSRNAHLQFAPALRQAVGRTVLDKTGLTGNFDFTLKFAVARPVPDETLNGGPSRIPICRFCLKLSSNNSA